MFTFGVGTLNKIKMRDIMLDEVDDKFYFSQEVLDNFVYEKSYGTVGRIGYIDRKTDGRVHQSDYVYDWNKLASTLLARDYKDPQRVICYPKKGMGTIEYQNKRYSVRKLTPLEYWRLQGIPDDMFYRAQKKISNTKLYERAGRSICIPMLEDIFKKFFEKEDFDKLTVLEAFSGIGSQRIALQRQNIPHESVGIMEVDRYGLLAYDAIHNDQSIDYSVGKTDKEMTDEMEAINIAYNFSTYENEMPNSHKDIVDLYNATKRSHNFGDITKVTEDKLPNFNFFTYSFPCKNISLAGNRKGFEKDSGTQSSLVWECERIIREKRPKYLMMENVKNICGNENIGLFREWIALLESYGYKSEWGVYNAMDYGVPQNRERVIMMSKLVK